MKKAQIVTLASFGLAALGYSGFIGYEHSQLPTRWKQLTPLNVPLVDQGNGTFRTQFQAGFSEPHYLELTFPKKPNTQDAISKVRQWNDPRLGKDQLPTGPDLKWQLLENGKLVASGTGEQISAWVGQSISIGQFNLKSGHRYTLMTVIGPDFQKFMSCEPRIGVEVSTASVSIGLAIDRDFGLPYAIGVGSAGILLLLVAIGNYWFTRSRGIKQHA